MHQSADVFAIFGWLVFAAVVIVGGFVVAVAVRRWVQREERAVGSFTFQDLRDMRARGEITEQEFAAMRTALLARMDLDQAAEAPEAGEPPPDVPSSR
jgi:uncharacterized membrane protein